MKAVLVVPTYKESENCTNLVLAEPSNFYFLVVEGNSTDGTGELAEGLAAGFQRGSLCCTGKARKHRGVCSLEHTCSRVGHGWV